VGELRSVIKGQLARAAERRSEMLGRAQSRFGVASSGGVATDPERAAGLAAARHCRRTGEARDCGSQWRAVSGGSRGWLVSDAPAGLKIGWSIPVSYSIKIIGGLQNRRVHSEPDWQMRTTSTTQFVCGK
jgi:hypothetical protein